VPGDTPQVCPQARPRSGGPIELAKETMASLRSATLPPSQEELLDQVRAVLGVT
jgi:hypothetical protein